MRELIAQTSEGIPLYDSAKGFLKGFGPLGLEEATEGEGAPQVFNNFISGAIGIMTVIAFIWFIFLLISGALGIMSSGGDKTGLENSRKRIANGIIGIVVIIAAIFIIRLVGYLFGLEDIILNPASFIKSFDLSK